MYSTLLSIHSLIRWFVLICLIFALYRAYGGWFKNRLFSRFDDKVRLVTVNIVQLQMTIGIWLYFISPIIDYFLENFKEAIHERQLRFFGMEHSLMMLTGVVIISIGARAVKRKATDKAKFKTMAIWFTIGLLIILSSIPWEFSPLISRPYFRPF